MRKVFVNLKRLHGMGIVHRDVKPVSTRWGRASSLVAASSRMCRRPAGTRLQSAAGDTSFRIAVTGAVWGFELERILLCPFCRRTAPEEERMVDQRACMVVQENILVTNVGNVKLIDFGAAVDMCTGINFNPLSGMLDPRCGAKTQGE